MVEATCMWAPDRSRCRKAESSPLRRSSPPTAGSSHTPAGRLDSALPCGLLAVGTGWACDLGHTRQVGSALPCATEHTYAIDLPSRPETPGASGGTKSAGTDRGPAAGANRAVIRP